MNLHRKVDIGLDEISYIPIGASSNNSLDYPSSMGLGKIGGFARTV